MSSEALKQDKVRLELLDFPLFSPFITHEMNLEYYYYRMTAGFEHRRKMSQISVDEFLSFRLFF